MSDFNAILRNIHRPKLLIRAARIGAADYKRERDLKRLTRTIRIPSPTSAVETLMATETQIEENRVAGDANYSITRHVEVLTALMAEARLLPRPVLTLV